MTDGLLSHLVKASHIAAGIGCSFGEAMEIVKAAHMSPAEPAPITVVDNVVYGVDFRQGRQ